MTPPSAGIVNHHHHSGSMGNSTFQMFITRPSSPRSRLTPPPPPVTTRMDVDHQVHIMAQVNAAIERQNSFQKHLVKQRELAMKGEVAVTVFKNASSLSSTDTPKSTNNSFKVAPNKNHDESPEWTRASFTTVQEDPADEGDEDYSPKRMLMPREHYQYLKRDRVIMKRAMSTPSLEHLSKSRSSLASLKDHSLSASTSNNLQSRFGLIRRTRPRADGQDEKNEEFIGRPASKKMRMQRQYQSAPNVNSDVHNAAVKYISGPASAAGTSLSTTSVTGRENTLQQQQSPQEHLKHMFEKQGYTARTYMSLEHENFFQEVTPEQIAAYDTKVISAVRNEDIDELRRMSKIEGRNLQCCNKFGESILHMACRRGSTKVVKFLLCEAGVSTRVRDDYGRTPLHDACWTREPQFELVSLLIESCPDLLSVSDKRGHTPLSYVRRDHWDAWIKFMDEHPQLVIPKELPEVTTSTKTAQ